jgi:hypothetical protein
MPSPPILRFPKPIPIKATLRSPACSAVEAMELRALLEAFIATRPHDLPQLAALLRVNLNHQPQRRRPGR